MPSNKSYKETLKKVLRMRSAAALAVYERTKLLCQVFNDAEFRADAGNVDDFRAADELDKYVDDLPYNFLQLRSMLAAAPDESTWKDTPLRDIYAKAVEKATPPREQKHTRRTVTTKEFDDLKDNLKAVEARAKFTEQMLQERTKSCEELLEENRELRRQLAMAEGRIQELERLLSRSGVAASA